uniref:Uncharacterized protein n=1 Tax=Rhizophora mucronata TaxID=61149 RepID=A0A2P2JIV6_RHIMU
MKQRFNIRGKDLITDDLAGTSQARNDDGCTNLLPIETPMRNEEEA